MIGLQTNKARFGLLSLAVVLVLWVTYTTEGSKEILEQPISLVGTKDIAKKTLTLKEGSLIGKNSLSLTYDLKGVCLLGGPASYISLSAKDAAIYSVSLSNYGKNCANGEQTISIPLSDFGMDQPLENIENLEMQFWYPTEYAIEIKTIEAKASFLADTSAPEVKTFISENLYDPNPLKISRAPATVELKPRATQEPTIKAQALTAVATLTTSDTYIGQYWNNPGTTYNPKFPTSAPDLTRTDSRIAFNWDRFTPGSPIKADHFAVRWTRNTQFQEGTYRFTVTSDDGVRIYIDNQLILDKWVNQGAVTHTVDRKITAGTHTVKVEYYEDSGSAQIYFKFALLSQTTNTSASGTTNTTTATPTPTPTPVPIPTSTQTASSWTIRSVSSMKETKDKICGQDTPQIIQAWVARAQEIGANYVAVETPYDNPSCGNSVAYTKAWNDAIRAKGLNVWHRHAPLAFEGIYNTPKDNSTDYLQFISNYIKTNPTLFRAGDIFTPIPEPQNGGIAGITYCPQNKCIFKDAASFNKWLRDAITTSEAAFASIGLGGKIKIGYYGLDGFVVWGDNNPDWDGILEDATVQAMGNITIDHYPEIVGDTMENDLNELQTKYPNTPIIIGEWGTITGGDVITQVQKSMKAAQRKNVIGFNYWHMGMGGNESLVYDTNGSILKKAAFDSVQSFFRQ